MFFLITQRWKRWANFGRPLGLTQCWFLIEGAVDLGSNGHIVPALVSLVYTFTQIAGEMDVETHCEHGTQFTKEELNQAEFVGRAVEAVLMEVMKESGQGLVIQKEGISAKARQIARERLGLE